MEIYLIEAFGRTVGSLPRRTVVGAKKPPQRAEERFAVNEDQELLMTTYIKDAFPDWEKAIDIPKLEAGYEAEDIDKVLDSVDFDKLELPQADSINLDTIAKSAAIEINGIPQVKGEFEIDMESESVKEFLNASEISRSVNIDEQAIKSITSEYRNGINKGINSKSFAKEIRDNIGLNNPQTKALMNYRAQLEKQELPAKRIEALIEKRREKMLTYRAGMIARTETTRASAFGVQETGNQIVSQGLFTTEEVFKKWVAILDDKTTTSCEFRDAADAVPIDKDFPDPSGQFGPVYAPPGHVLCRSDMIIEIRPAK